MCWWDSELVLCVVLLSEVTRNLSGILPGWNLSPHTCQNQKDFHCGICYNYGKVKKFKKCWLEQPEFSWLKARPHNEFEVQCTLCKRTLNLGKLGVKALVSHTKSEKHQLASKSLQQSHTITHFCMPLSPVPGSSSSSSARPELGAVSAALHSIDIQTIFGSTLTLKAEVLWILNTVAKHFGNRFGC